MQHHLLVIGGGAAGLTAASVARLLGRDVALVEARHTGGECTWTGCVPSKALLAAAKAAHHARTAQQFGIQVGSVEVDLLAALRYVRSTITAIYHEETPEALRAQGIAVYEGWARFVDPHTVELHDGRRIRARYIIVATGAPPFIPPGLAAVPYLTHETLFDLDTTPEHLLIVGGGAVGVEMAQAFGRLGVAVTLISRSAQLVPRLDADAAALITAALTRAGVRLITGQAAEQATHEAGSVMLDLANGERVRGSHLLIATGKRPDVSGLHPQAAGLATRDGQLIVNANLRTSQRHIFAAGDVLGAPYQTHYASAQATSAALNCILPFALPGQQAHVPYALFTDPEVAQAGLTEAAARAAYPDVQVTRLPMQRADRAMTEGQPGGVLKLVHRPGGHVLGVTLVGYQAAEMLNPWLPLVAQRRRALHMALRPAVYPTMATTNTILAYTQLRQQLAGGGGLARLIRALARLKS